MTLGPATYAVRVFSGFASHWDFVAEEVRVFLALSLGFVLDAPLVVDGVG